MVGAFVLPVVVCLEELDGAVIEPFEEQLEGTGGGE